MLKRKISFFFCWVERSGIRELVPQTHSVHNTSIFSPHSLLGSLFLFCFKLFFCLFFFLVIVVERRSGIFSFVREKHQHPPKWWALDSSCSFFFTYLSRWLNPTFLYNSGAREKWISWLFFFFFFFYFSNAFRSRNDRYLARTERDRVWDQRKRKTTFGKLDISSFAADHLSLLCIIT